MAKTKNEVLYSAKIELHMTASQLAVPVDKSVVRSRGPKQLGQMKSNFSVHVLRTSQAELTKRIEMVKAILELGEVPAKIKPKEPLRGDTEKKAPVKASKKKETEEIPEEPVSEDPKSDEK